MSQPKFKKKRRNVIRGAKSIKGMSYDVCWCNGKIQPILAANISVANIEYSYGFGVYETMRVIDDAAYFLREHIQRLKNSAKIIGLAHEYTEEELVNAIKELITAITATEAYNLKIVLIGGKSASQGSLCIFAAAPLFTDRKMYRDGVTVMSAEYERPFPNAKTLSMLQSYLAYKKARERGCYDALAIDRNGCITEGTRTNFFLVKKNSIFTATKEKILDGVTKKIVLHLASQNGFIIKEKNIRLRDIANYDGAFLTSTSSKVIPIKKIDEVVFVTIPESIQKIGKMYNEYLERCGGVSGVD